MHQLVMRHDLEALQYNWAYTSLEFIANALRRDEQLQKHIAKVAIADGGHLWENINQDMRELPASPYHPFWAIYLDRHGGCGGGELYWWYGHDGDDESMHDPTFVLPPSKDDMISRNAALIYVAQQYWGDDAIYYGKGLRTFHAHEQNFYENVIDFVSTHINHLFSREIAD